MAGALEKLKRAKSRLSGKADGSIVVPFEVKCDCGEMVRGNRRDTWIEAECGHCSLTLFILLANVYPSTKLVPSEVLGGTFAERLKFVVAELLPKRKAKESPRPKKAAAKSKTDDTAEIVSANTETIVRPRIKLSLPRIDIVGAVKRTFTPFRLLMLAVIGVLGVTGYWVMHQRSVEKAQQAWLKSSDDIVEFLKDGNFIELEAALKQAVDAGRTLGKADADWRMTFNLYHETRAVNQIASGDLLTDFHKAYIENGQLKQDAARSLLFASQSGSFVIDTFVRQDDSKDGYYLFDLPASPGRHPVKASVALPQLKQFLDEFSDGRIFFAVRIESIEAPNVDSQDSADNVWFVRFVPQTFVLLTSESLCEEIGMSTDFDSELASILARQRDFIRNSDTWEFRDRDTPNGDGPQDTAENPK